MNGMFDLAAARLASLDNRIPPRVLRVLVTYAFVTAAIVGFGLAASRNRRPVGSTLVFLMVAMTIVLIVDLDRSQTGTIQVSEAPLTRVTEAIARAERAKRLNAAQAPSATRK